MDFAEVAILHYFGADSSVTIPDYIVVVRERCFSRCEHLCDVTFGFPSKVSLLETAAFEECVCLQSFCIPASVTSIGVECFTFCESLAEVTFEPGSKLSRIDREAFSYCSALKSIAIPSSLQSIGSSCLTDCEAVCNIVILPDSQLVRLERSFCDGCERLQSLFIPASVEFIGVRCFEKCDALSQLTFGAPSRLENLLDIPPRWDGFHAIPDGVTLLGVCARSGECVLLFGRDSKLEMIGNPSRMIRVGCHSFVQLSSRSLKRIRSHLEFA
jgi:hypothetical protein